MLPLSRAARPPFQKPQDINNRLAKLEALGQGGGQAKDGKSAPAGGDSKVLGLSLAATPTRWGVNSGPRAGKRELAGLEEDEQGSMKGARDWSARIRATVTSSGVSATVTSSGVSAAEGDSNHGGVGSPRGADNLLRGAAGSAHGGSVATDSSGGRSASSEAQRDTQRR